jgi:hypothetical protein
MTKRLSMFALMICFAGSLAFAGDAAKSKSCSTDATNATTDNSGAVNSSSAGKTPCPTTDEKRDKKKEHKAKQAPSKEEQEFDHMLLGIHG